jgi:hypothetical protein
MKLRESGLALRDIRALIDARWSATGPGTNTPRPA